MNAEPKLRAFRLLLGLVIIWGLGCSTPPALPPVTSPQENPDLNLLPQSAPTEVDTAIRNREVDALPEDTANQIQEAALLPEDVAIHNREAAALPEESTGGEGSVLQPGSVSSLAGSWSFVDPGYAGATLVFSEDFQVTMQMDSATTMQGTYSVDYTSDPLQLDIIWFEDWTLKTIIRFLDEQRLLLQNNDLDTDRPLEFTDDSVVLLRDKTEGGEE